MNKVKFKFFRRVKNAIFNFDEYQVFAEEKTRRAIRYLMSLIAILSLITAIVGTYKTIADFKNMIEGEVPDFSIENNELKVHNETGESEYRDPNGRLEIIMDSDRTEWNENEETKYDMQIVLLKDKAIVNQGDTKITRKYADVSDEYNLNNVNKKNIIDNISVNAEIVGIVGVGIGTFIIYFTQSILDVLLLSIVGLLVSRIVKVMIKYKNLFNMSVYAITLSLVLYNVYMIVNLYTGFTITYIRIAYDIINHIYLITVILIIRSNLTKQEA